MELSRIANQSANQNNGQTSRVKSLDEIVKMVRLLTVKVPNKSDGWEYFFSSLEKAFASEMVSDELKPKGKFYDEPERAKWNGSKRRSFNGSWGKQPFGEKKTDKFSSRKNFDKGTELEDGTVTARVDLLGKKVIPRRAIEDKLSKLVKTSISVDGKLVHALVDSGTEITVIKKDLVPEYRLKELPRFI
ncbi:hypothetical protein TNCV_4483231 [Trichonephila clavipes]|nr:hypothetical protein TNCV_4483231 [Trichonephila clavipes]